MRSLEGPEERGQHPVLGERDAADAQPPLRASADRLQLERRALELRQEPLRLLEQARALRRELHAPPASREQRAAQARLQAADRARQRRLRYMQRRRRAPEMQVL